ncbi:hypothetical protein [Holdemanella biformis]|uniref:hypothetical protein n=1 Tax=Holdemanella biformis TaxID=1735 RepID=UPI0022E210AD|nr:hypothetical protein [Holdemanella biformis]
MIRLQNNYAITSSGGSFALVTFGKGKDKEGNEIDVQKPISYHTTLESALQSYSNNRMADLVSNFDMDLKDVKKEDYIGQVGSITHTQKMLTGNGSATNLFDIEFNDGAIFCVDREQIEFVED